MSSVLGGMIFRGMARRATNSTRLQSSVNLNADDRLTVYKPAEWTPPPTNEEVFTTQTPDKRPMRWPMDFSLPRTPNRVSKGDRGVIMRLHHYGCKNRWMFHLVIHKERLKASKDWEHTVIEQLGTYDPIANVHGEKLVSLNIERILYWLAQGVKLDPHAGRLLGLAGLLPQHPSTYTFAWRNRKELLRETQVREQLESENKDNDADNEGVQSQK